MNEQECLARMIPPGQIRPGKMGNGGIVQILLTRACTLSCFGCTQGSNLAGKPTFMPLDHFEQAVVSLKDYFGLVALFGGQPTLHPHFPEICTILARHIPIERRGLWTNALNGYGAICRQTFLPSNCNLNVHLDKKAYAEFLETWPESRPFGLYQDSRHGPVHLAMQDVIPDEGQRWQLISNCDINIHWSSLVCSVRGQLRAFFCEIAGSMATLHEHDPDWPDTGLPVEPGWWRRAMQDFAEQVRWNCHRCAVPLRAWGALSQDESGTEQTSATHANVFKPKRPGRKVEVVTSLEQLGLGRIQEATAYLKNAGK